MTQESHPLGGLRLAIIGTRLLACPGEADRVALRIARTITVMKPAVVISGGAPGVDSIAEAVARVHGYDESAGTLIIHRPAVRTFDGPGGYRERDLRIATDCTHLLRVACIRSRTYGSGWTADEAARQGKPVARLNECGNQQPAAMRDTTTPQRCPSTQPHDEHEWITEGLRRQCAGLRLANRRAGLRYV